MRLVKRMRAAGMAAALVVFMVRWCWAQEWQWQDAGRGMSQVRSVCVVDGKLPVLLAGAGSGVSFSEDGGLNWKQVLRVRGENARVYDIRSYGTEAYAATSSGVYYSADRGRQWKWLYRGSDDLSRQCVAVRGNGAHILAASAAGLLVSRDLGLSWQKVSGVLGGSRVTALAQSAARPDVFAAAAGSSVYLSRDNGNAWELVYAAGGNGRQAEGEDMQGSEEEAGINDITALSFDGHDPQCVYLSTERYVARSGDGGRTWQRLSDAGLVSKDIQVLSVSGGRLYAAGNGRVFMLDNDSWRDVSAGLAGGTVYALVPDSAGRIYAGTARGLFVGSVHSGEHAQGQSDVVNGIPDIQKLQQAAIDYAMVGMDKIADWHRRASRRAWLPSVSLGFDRDTSELWHWEGGSTTRSTDDELRRGKDTLDWDVSLSWDLGDLVWSNDQTSIDTRSRLLVQLRNEILDELNKLYFEYLRTAVELADLPPADSNKAAAKKLRLQELAAGLNALTGNKFSTAKPGIAVENFKE